MPDAALGAVMAEQANASMPLRRAIDGLFRCLPDLAPAVRADRNVMMRQLLVRVPAERERALAEGLPTPHTSWRAAEAGLADAVAGLCWRP